MKWLLQQWGYSTASGVDSLEEAVRATERARQFVNLPERYIVLNDWNDAGMVVLDSGATPDPDRWPVYWLGAHNLRRLAAGFPLDADCGTFAGFAEWAIARLSLTA